MEALALPIIGFIVLAYIWNAGAGTVVSTELESQEFKAQVRLKETKFKGSQKLHKIVTSDKDLISLKEAEKVFKARSGKSAEEILAGL
jgi:hypothetical protein